MAAVMAAVLRYLCNYGPNYFAELCYEPKFLGTHPRKMTVEDTCPSFLPPTPCFMWLLNDFRIYL